MMDLLVATVRRILGARETLLAVPRQLDLMWAETRPTGPIYRCFATMNFSAEDPACFDLAECLRMAGGRPLRLRDFIWANVYLALA
ncbi:hypothetical protein CHU98_g9317 [Xylaria longipes]|nr:hypothetical protein CHU98_g9317 [Xylaria longipes]